MPTVKSKSDFFAPILSSRQPTENAGKSTPWIGEDNRRQKRVAGRGSPHSDSVALRDLSGVGAQIVEADHPIV
jgi:hypothetical protein